MNLNHIYNGFAVYHDDEMKEYIVDGYEKRISSIQEVYSFIDNLSVASFLDNKAVSFLYKLGYFRTSFIIDCGLVKEEKWSNEKNELKFYYDSLDVEVQGRIDSIELEKIIRNVLEHSKPKKDEETIISNIIKGNLKANSTKKGEIKDINKVSSLIARGIFAHLDYNQN